MIRPVCDPAIINGFANHPDIGLGGGAPLDLTQGIREPNVFLFGEHGGICLSWSAPETFEAHVMLTRAGRGRWGFEAGREAVRYMAARRCTHIWARIHPERREIALFARQAGLRDTGFIHELDAGEGPVRWRIFNWRA